VRYLNLRVKAEVARPMVQIVATKLRAGSAVGG
jgi:hypothetical protein